MDNHILKELKKIDIAILQQMFAMTKEKNIKQPPSPLQCRILGYLIENKNIKVCQRDLEININVSKAAISGVINTMEASGLIKRSSSSNDARSKIIVITDDGLNRFNQLKELENKLEKKIINNIPDDELHIFLSVLNTMQSNLEIIKGRKYKC